MKIGKGRIVLPSLAIYSIDFIKTKARISLQFGNVAIWCGFLQKLGGGGARRGREGGKLVQFSEKQPWHGGPIRSDAGLGFECVVPLIISSIGKPMPKGRRAGVRRATPGACAGVSI